MIGYLLLQMELWLIMLKKRIKDHVGRFNRLYDGLMNDKIDEEYIEFLKRHF